MYAHTAAVLEPVGAGRVALESVAIDCQLRGLLAETEVTQSYRNTEAVNIEAVYSFPLPLAAVLLEIELTLNGETLRGQVQPRAHATAAYEDAIDDGHSALLLESAGPGLYTLNVGNLMAGEGAVIRLRYAQLLRWQGHSLRLQLPTTIAPRYGDPAAAGLAPHQVPKTALTTGYGFTLCVTLHGKHAVAYWSCPSHMVAVESTDGLTRVRLSGGSAMMDRDFVLVLREAEAAGGSGLWAPDGERFVALASFHPTPPAGLAPPPRRVTLMVDCSGSMLGDSIAQARAALHEILALLNPADRFELIAFGSQHRALFGEPVPATPDRISQAARFVDRLDADMGGTEIGAALHTAWGAGDVLLITDGEVWNGDDLIEQARGCGSRLFTVGVGSAVSEAFVRELAERSGGACELVSPNEQMAEGIVRQFRRMDQPPATAVRVHWPTAPKVQAPAALHTVYAGDTVHVFAWLDSAPSGEARLLLTLDDGRELVAVTGYAADEAFIAPADLPRIAARQRLPELTADEATKLAVDYQLITDTTSCVLVKQRRPGEQAADLPALRQVPQALAAGWGGTGRIGNFPPMALDSSPPPFEVDTLATPAFLRRHDSLYDAPSHLPDEIDPMAHLAALANQLNAAYPARAGDRFDHLDLAWLTGLGMDKVFTITLAELIDDDTSESDVVRAVLRVLADSYLHRRLSRQVRRLIRRSLKNATPDERLVREVMRVVEALVLP